MPQDEDEFFALSEAGAALMQKVLLRAAKELSFDITAVNASNLTDYLQTLADSDLIWEGSDISIREERVVLLVVVLGTYVNSHHTPKDKDRYN